MPVEVPKTLLIPLTPSTWKDLPLVVQVILALSVFILAAAAGVALIVLVINYLVH